MDQPLQPRVAIETFPAAEGNEAVTRQTVELMCRYILESAIDPDIKEAALWIRQHFGKESSDPAMCAWAVFWYVKHRVKFQIDDGPMVRLTEKTGIDVRGNQDLLTSPAVLIRMKDAREDCDGFTMLVCALLCCLNVPFVIVTIACDPSDPERFSHVFPMALLPGGPLALDASHGSGPGWMVPANRTYRWQAWDLSGEPVSVGRPRDWRLHGWVPTGLGDDTGAVDPSQLAALPAIGTATDFSSLDNITPWATPAQPSSTLGTSSGFDLNSLLNTIGNTAGNIANTIELGNLTPAQIAAMNNSSPFTSSSLNSWLPLLGFGLLAVVAIGALKK